MKATITNEAIEAMNNGNENIYFNQCIKCNQMYMGLGKEQSLCQECLDEQQN